MGEDAAIPPGWDGFSLRKSLSPQAPSANRRLHLLLPARRQRPCMEALPQQSGSVMVHRGCAPSPCPGSWFSHWNQVLGSQTRVQTLHFFPFGPPQDADSPLRGSGDEGGCVCTFSSFIAQCGSWTEPPPSTAGWPSSLALI